MEKEASIQITGMTCAACATRIEKVLNKMDGISTANGDYPDDRKFLLEA